jgi:hypothetical protein
MLISHSKNFLFVHVPKTAGLSMTAALNPFCDHPENALINRILSKFGVDVNWFGPTISLKYGRIHTTARQMKTIFPNEVFEEYYKFAFVRNPWDLMVSYYHYIQSNTEHHRSRKVQALGGFKQYLKYEIKRNKINQTHFLTDAKGNLIVDFVGHFESLAEDFDIVRSTLGITANMEHYNGSKHRDYRSYYDEETKQMVANHWKEDIERFGYTFDGII